MESLQKITSNVVCTLNFVSRIVDIWISGKFSISKCNRRLWQPFSRFTFKSCLFNLSKSHMFCHFVHLETPRKMGKNIVVEFIFVLFYPKKNNWKITIYISSSTEQHENSWIFCALLENTCWNIVFAVIHMVMQLGWFLIVYIPKMLDTCSSSTLLRVST